MTTRRKALQIRVIVVLAVRNLRRQVRRTVLTALAIVLGAGMLVFSNAIGDGTHEQWIDDGVRTGSGHVTIEHPAFRMSRKLEDRLAADVRAAAEVALATPALADRVTGVSAQLTINGMASSAAGARPAHILAVDPQAEIDFTILDEQVIEGRYLQSDDRLAAFVGVGLMETLNLRPRMPTRKSPGSLSEWWACSAMGPRRSTIRSFISRSLLPGNGSGPGTMCRISR